MCIVALAWQVIEGLPLCLLSNRDEFYARPTQALKHWENSPIIAGQDLQSGGTWMGMTETGRWAVITNYRDASDQRTYSTSRGDIVADYLASELPPIRFAQQLEQYQQDYAGFNLIVGDRQQAIYMSNRGEAPQVLANGVYVVSNGLMSEHWAKTQHLRHRFVQELLPLLVLPDVTESELQQVTWDILEDPRQRLPEQLPQTGICLELEQLLSSTFIVSPNYGTRCSNFLRIFSQHCIWLEKTQYAAKQDVIQNIEFDFQ